MAAGGVVEATRAVGRSLPRMLDLNPVTAVENCNVHGNWMAEATL